MKCQSAHWVSSLVLELGGKAWVFTSVLSSLYRTCMAFKVLFITVIIFLGGNVVIASDKMLDIVMSILR